MNVPITTPSHLLRVVAALARWALWLMLGAWFIFGALWGALHWVIVPRIGDFRPELQAQASRVLGVPVTIGAIKATSQGLIPSFELDDVKLLDAQGATALWLPRVMVALSPQSLLGLGFEQLHIERPELNIRRTQDGKLIIAGLDFSKTEPGDGSVADWFFSQKEFVIRHGTVQWTDDLRKLPTLSLNEVDLVVRNRYHKHELRLDASLPPSMGERLTTVGIFRQPLLSLHNGQWREWDGQLYGVFDRVDVSALGRHVDLGVDVMQGQGGLRAWVDVRQGQVTQATADVTLADVHMTLGKKLAPLTLKTVAGRLGGSLLPDGFEFWTENLQFQTQDGLRWPGGNLRINYTGAPLDGADKGPGRAELQADKLDLATLAQIASRLPLGEQAQASLEAWVPKGVIEKIQASWQSLPGGAQKYQAKGRVVGFEVSRALVPGPAIRGATIDFDLTQSAGKANVVMSKGSIALPGLFDDPLIAMNQLSGDAQWQIAGDKISVQVPNLKFSNDDGQGEAQLKWQTGDGGAANVTRGRTRFPGVVDLQGSMTRLDGTRVHRYLPSIMRPNVREYVREAIQKGQATDVKFKAKGYIFELPYANPKLGEFSISAKMSDATFAYVPRSLARADSLPWPVLTELSGDLLIDRLKLQVKVLSGKLVNASGVGQGSAASLQIIKAEGQIADLLNSPTVVVSADGRGPFTNALALVNSSPVGQIIGEAVARATATGTTDLKLKLNLPIGALERTTVQGSLTAAGSEIQISPATPLLSGVRGQLNFTERGFSLANVQGRMFGGDIALEGGTVLPASTAVPAVQVAQAQRVGPGIVLRAKGNLTAEAMRQSRDLGMVARIAQQASGAAAYSAVLGFRDGVPELAVASDLVGLALNLPAPFSKPAETALPLKYENGPLRDRSGLALGDKAQPVDQLKLELGRIGAVSYVRDVSGADPKVLRGSIAVGLSPDESAPMPQEGVVANVNVARLNLDAWNTLLTHATGVKLAVPEPQVAVVAQGGAPVSGAVLAAAPATASPTMPAPAPSRGALNPALGYLPTTMAIRAGELTVAGRTLTNVVVGGSREGLTWRANLDAGEVNGYAEYRQSGGAGAGRVYARLARVTLAQTSAKDVEAVLEEQPSAIPALDIVVENMELRGKKLGRIEIEAVNRGAGAVAREGGVREWRLAKFNIVTPEALFTASGNWAGINAQSPRSAVDAGRVDAERRRTVMNFKLDILDAGELLTRFGMKEVFRKGKGKLEGQVAWAGSPLTPDYPSMGGAFTVNMESGQFLKADPVLAKLLGVLSLQSLPRRLALDFRDVFSEGFSFDFVRGDVKIDQGIASTNNLQMKGVNAAVLMDGRADIAKETQDIRVIVVPEINAGTASLIATAINPAIGLGTFLAQILLRGPLIEAATQEFHIDGSWLEPQVTQVKRKGDSRNAQKGGWVP